MFGSISFSVMSTETTTEVTEKKEEISLGKCFHWGNFERVHKDERYIEPL
jgi:hypothetical protein